MIMSSGRSARLPPTPNAPNNKKWAPKPTGTTTGTPMSNLNESNSNNLMYQYSNPSSVPTNMSHHHRNQMDTAGIADNNGVKQTADVAAEGRPAQTIDSLGPDFSMTTSKVLESLSENERKMIIEVLNRDENVRQRDSTRIM